MQFSYARIVAMWSKPTGGIFYLLVFGTRVLNSVGGLASAVLVVSKYSEYDAGKIYSLISILALVFVLESGMPFLVLQRASVLTKVNGWHSLEPQARFEYVAPVLCHYLLLTIAIIFFIVWCLLFPIGFLLPDKISGGGGIWFCSCIAVTLFLPLATTLNFLEGLGYLKELAVLRFIQALVAQTVLILMLSLDQGVLSVTMQLIASIFVGFMALLWGLSEIRFNWLDAFKNYKSRLNFSDVFQEDWPLQWRLWVNSLSTYFSNQAWVLGVSLTGDMSLAVKLGTGLQIVNAAVGFSVTPLASRIAQLTALASAKSMLLYKNLLNSLILESIITGIFVLIFALVGYAWILHSLPNTQSKLFSIAPSFLLGLSIIFCAASAALVLLNQSLGRDDLYKISVARVIISLVSIIVMHRFLDDLSICILYTGINFLMFMGFFFLHKNSTKRVFDEG